MHKYKVLKDFIDKNTKEKYSVNDQYETTNERGSELIKLGYLDKTAVKRPKKTVKADESE